MNILLITTSYPPSPVIAAKRYEGLVKYMHINNNITAVTRDAVNESKYGERIISCDTTKDTELRYANTTLMQFKVRKQNDIIKKIKKSLYLLIYWRRMFNQYKTKKDILERLKKEGAVFDVIISSFGEAENLLAGRYAAELFECPLVQDFRDPLPKGKNRGYSWITTFVHSLVEKYYSSKADAITVVSEDMIKGMCLPENKKPIVVRNGYIEDNTDKIIFNNKKEHILKFCYTGSVYKNLDDFTPLFYALNDLCNNGAVEKQNIRFDIAGRNIEIIEETAKRFDLEDIITNHGYVSFEKAKEIQTNCDIFVVVRWNNVGDEGIVSGKFYEGIRAHKPMLVLMNGNLGNSELYRYNEKYNYGFVYEEARKESHFDLLKDYLFNQYKCKINGEYLIYNPSKELFEDFEYKKIAESMEKVCRDAIKNYKKR